ncbi:MAG: hypothetical protein ACREP0_13705, partial [Rhodanobacteraceae bacterium]
MPYRIAARIAAYAVRFVLDRDDDLRARRYGGRGMGAPSMKRKQMRHWSLTEIECCPFRSALSAKAASQLQHQPQPLVYAAHDAL